MLTNNALRKRLLARGTEPPLGCVGEVTIADHSPNASTTGLTKGLLGTTGEIEIADRRYATAKRVAEIFSVTPRTVARWDAARIGPPKIKVGRLCLYDLGKLPEWLSSRETRPIRNQSGSGRTAP